MLCLFLRNSVDNGVVAATNALIAKGEPWRLVYRGVLSMWAERNIAVDGSRILAYCLLMPDGSIVRVDTFDWLLVEVKSADDGEENLA